MHFVYVIYSPSADSYYIGETVNVEERLIQHRQHTYAGSYTKIANDWEVAFLLRCKDRSSALNVEAQLKGDKSKIIYKWLHYL
jgi:putative endonuclease